MKILLTIHHNFDPDSGAPGTVLKLGRCYEQLGHQVDYYSFDHLPDWVRSHSPEVTFPEFLAAYLGRHAYQYNVVDASTGDAWVWGRLVRHFSRQRPLLVTRSHGLEHTVHLQFLEDVRLGKQRKSWKYPIYRGGFQLWEVKQSLQCADLAFMLNQHDRKYAVEVLGVSPEQAYVTHNGIPDSFLNLPWQVDDEAKDKSLRIVQIGTYIPRKGIQYSVPALNQVLQQNAHVRLTLLGTGCPETEVLRDFDPVVCDRIQVIPRFEHNRLPQLLKGHHIKLFTPLSEGFGKALVEAMACGLAPVTTAAPGPLEVVCDGHDALVVPLYDSSAIAEALNQLIGNRAYLNQLRRQAYVTAQQYGWTRIAQHRIDLYQKALDQRE